MDTIKKFNDFITKMNKSNSRNYKLSVLENYAEDDDIKYYLDFIFNPYITSGISDKKINKFAIVKSNIMSLFSEYIEFNSVKELLEYIKANNTGTDEVLKTINNFLASNKFEENEINLIKSIITKNIILGIDVKTINKIMNNLIPTFNVMLANKYFDKPELVEGKMFAITEKIDGGRIIALKKDNEVKFYTRAGQLYEGLVDLEKELIENFPDNICLDGEITLLDSEGISSKDAYKQTMKITRKDGEKHGIKMLVFDYMTYKDFETQNCELSYIERREKLEKEFNSSNKYFKLLPILYLGKDTNKILEILNEEVAKDHEGIMINICNAKYEFKRTNNLLKVKLMKSYDMKIVGFEEGTNRLSNNLGAILVKYKDSNIVKVGSGFSDEMRVEIWNNKEKYLNKIAEIQYFEETTNQDGGQSLRFPVFLDIRSDKVVGDF